MKKQIVLNVIIIVIMFTLGLTGKALATSQNVDDGEGIVENYVENTEVGNNIQMPGTNTDSTDYVNDISNKLQNMTSKQPQKDMRKQVVVTVIIIIITVLLIVGLITWYYMTNQ